MARIRTVKPEFWADEKIGELKRDIRLLFIGLWNLADDVGVLSNSPAFIKGQLFPYDEDLRISTIKEWLASLVEARMLIPFDYEGQGYLFIRTFKEHQVINKPSNPKIKDLAFLEGVLREYSCSSVVVLPLGKERKVKEGNGQAHPIFESNLFRQPNPPTKDEVFMHFLKQLQSVNTESEIKDMCRGFMNKYDATGWFLNGSPIKVWRSLANNYISNWKKNEK